MKKLIVNYNLEILTVVLAIVLGVSLFFWTSLTLAGKALLGFMVLYTLDRLYVHKDYQRQGVATALCNELERGFDKITTHASITAKPFFLHRGYQVVREQQVVRNGISLTNYVMEK